MASKQLGKLRQWAGEVISSREKMMISDEFKDLEKDVQLREGGINRLIAASEIYQKGLSKKKACDALDDSSEKLIPIDTLGIVMITHGEDFGQDSVYGTSLVKFGRAHCRIAALQESYSITFKDSFLNSMEKFSDEIKEYELQKKKLESRRLSYDAALSKLDKAKKDKDKSEAEEEVERAKFRYEETSEDLRAIIHSIQENEIDQFRVLTAFLDMEVNFVEQYLQVLKETKQDWNATSPKQVATTPKDRQSASPTKAGRPMSTRSRTSTGHHSRPHSVVASDSSADEEDRHKPPSRRPSHNLNRSESNTSRTSRPASRASRKRSDSAATTGEKDKDKTDSLSKRINVAGWASSAMGSVTGRSKKNGNRDKFTSLGDGDSEQSDNNDSRVSKSPIVPSHMRKRSKSSLSSPSPKITSKILKPPSMQDRKIVRALYDFNGSADELPFKVGDEILVLNEVLDGWWMGELNNRTGLFPTSYTEVVSKGTKMHNLPVSEDEYHGYGTSDVDEDVDFASKPLVAAHHDRSPFFGGMGIDMDSQGEEEQHLMSSISKRTEDDTRIPQRPASTRSVTDSLPKKPPPPPPPRRSTTSVVAPPSLPPRRPGVGGASSSSGSLRRLSAAASSSVSSYDYDESPFNSVADISSNGCSSFKQSPFKAKGMCSNCLKMHD